jgi:hypothetical protein
MTRSIVHLQFYGSCDASGHDFDLGDLDETFAVWAYRPKIMAIPLSAVIQTSVRSTIQRFGRTWKTFGRV